MQSYLATLGFYGEAKWIDGKYGSGTKESIEKFKKYYNQSKYRKTEGTDAEKNLSTDSSIDKKTISKMLLVYMALERKPEIYFDIEHLTYFSSQKLKPIKEMVFEEVQDYYKNAQFAKYKAEKDENDQLKYSELQAMELAEEDANNASFRGLYYWAFNLPLSTFQKDFFSKTIHYSLDAVPLTVYDSLVDPDGKVFKSYRQAEMNISKWEIKRPNQSQGTSTVVEGRNKLVIFKGLDGKQYMIVDWITDIEEGEDLGTLNAYIDGQEDPIISKYLKVYPLNPETNSKNTEWDKFAFEIIKELRNEGYKIKDNVFKLSVPLQIVRGMIFQESKYSIKEESLVRYEPFWDHEKYYMGTAYSHLKKTQFHLTSGETIYNYVWGPESNTTPAVSMGHWTYPKLKEKYKEILKDKDVATAKLFLELFLNYGESVAMRWYNTTYTEYIAKDIEEDKIPAVYMLFNPKQYSEVYYNIGKTYNSQTLNDNASGDGCSPDKWESLGSKGNIDIFKEHFDQLISNNMVDKAIKYLELYMKYGFNEADAWYDGNSSGIIKEDSNPEITIGAAPFIAQKIIASSWGPMQVMFPVAYGGGYKYYPRIGGTDVNGNEVKPLIGEESIRYGINHLAIKVNAWVDYLNYKKEKDDVVEVETEDWFDFWITLLQTYNGYSTKVKYRNYNYSIKVRYRAVAENLLPYKD